MLSGKIKDYDFTKDLGYRLVEIKNVEVESVVKGQKEIKPVVVLEDQKTKTTERFFVSPKLRLGGEQKNRYDEIIEAQRCAMEAIRNKALGIHVP